jgi:dTDP-glucose 4,6-dehydratase
MSLKKVQFIEEDLQKLFKHTDTTKLEKLRNSKIAITGGAGFIGTWLLEVIHFLNNNFDYKISAIIFDRDFERLKGHAPHLHDNPNFEMKRSDVRYLVELPKDTNYLIHAAGVPDNRTHLSNPVDVMSTLAIGVEQVLKATDRLSDFRMFVNLSSSLVYGSFNDCQRPTKESDRLASSHEASPYVAGKIYAENFVSSYRQQFRTPALTLRPFTFVGPYQTITSPWALNNFINDAINSNTIKVLGSGKTVRSFLYGADVAVWILTALSNGKSGDLYNLGSPEAVELATVAKDVTSFFSTPKEIMFVGSNVKNEKVSYMVADTSLIDSTFGLKPAFSNRDAIKRSIDWYLLGN